jgi:hypothetical protein
MDLVEPLDSSHDLAASFVTKNQPASFGASRKEALSYFKCDSNTLPIPLLEFLLGINSK